MKKFIITCSLIVWATILVLGAWILFFASEITLLHVRGYVGHTEAQSDLAWKYYTGDGVEKDIDKFIYWLSRIKVPDNLETLDEETQDILKELRAAQGK